MGGGYWFAAIEMIQLAADQDWLHLVTKEISKCWWHKRARRQIPLPEGLSVSNVTLRKPILNAWFARLNQSYEVCRESAK